MQNFDEVITFWFTESSQEDWFGAKPEFDEKLHDRFFKLHGQVAAGEAYGWRTEPLGRLAEILVLDQFSRQFYRGEARAFASDAMALTLAQEVVMQGLDNGFDSDQKMFAYMPYMHSESLVVHDEAVRLFTALESEKTLEFEMMHKRLIERFGRYPKRNEALGRQSTAEELEYISGRDGEHF